MSSTVDDLTPSEFSLQTTDMMYLVLEYCDGGDLDAFLHKHGRLPVATAKDLMRQLGMAFIWIRIFRRKIIWALF